MTHGQLPHIKLLIIIGMLASALHFADNALNIGRYPEPSWITPPAVVGTWLLFNILAVAVLTRHSVGRIALICASLYAAFLLSGLLHYVFGPPLSTDPRSNATVLLEAAAGVLLAAPANMANMPAAT